MQHGFARRFRTGNSHIPHSTNSGDLLNDLLVFMKGISVRVAEVANTIM